MQQYDVVRLRDGDLVLILQSDLLAEFSTRVVVPLIPKPDVSPVPKLHPGFQVGRRQLVFAFDQITTVRVADIVKVIGSASDLHYELQRAYDIVLSGL